MSQPLIDQLVADLTPAPTGVVARRLALGVGVGAAASAVLVLLMLGPRPDMAVACTGPMFWLKLAYPLALAAAAFGVCERLTRPAGGLSRGPWLALPCAIVLALAAAQLLQAPAPERTAMVMGGSASVCPWLILGASLPPFAGLVWAARALAPTRLRLAGLMLGLAAGGAGAAAYALHCTETTAPFLAVWYSLGMALAGVLGALAGPRLLRWR